MIARSPGFDSQALEARTQAIGQELFTAAKREHAHLSVLNRWTAQVLSWCLSDPGVKGNVLRFIDVLPSLQSPRAIAQHVLEYFPTTNDRLPAALRLGATLAHPGPFTAPSLAVVVRQLVEQVARQFIAERHPDGLAHVIHHLATLGVTCSLDVLGEQVLSEADADQYMAQCGELVREAAAAYARLTAPSTIVSCGPRVNLSVKPSALTPRFDPISPIESVERALLRLVPLVQRVSELKGTVNLDVEQYELRDLTILLAKRVLAHPRVGGKASLGLVVQAYLRDADAVVDDLLAFLSAHEQPLMIRLVKGAYWDHEHAWAAQRHWPAPVYQEKAQTDHAFEHLTRRLLGAHPLVTTVVASHNIRSIAHAMAVAELLQVPPSQMEFQLLYGMGDAIRPAITSRGYPVRIYTPVGALIPGMAYLVRRLLENTANDSFLRQEFLQERSAESLLQPPVTAPRAAPPPSQTTAWSGEPLLDLARTEERMRLMQALTMVRTQLGKDYPMILADRAKTSADTVRVHNPAKPDELIGTVSQASLADVNHAVRLAGGAQPAWARTPVKERAACLARAAQQMRQRRYELAAWEVFEVGKTWREADVDIVEAIEYLEYYSRQMTALAQGKPLPQMPGERNTYVYRPRGVAVVIAPWNFPAAILTGMASAALVSGNAVIIKPAEQSPVMAYHVTDILRQAGVPQAVIQCLAGLGADVGASLVRHPGTHTVLFTGSKAVGLSIIKAAAQVGAGQRFVKHVVTEMGGKNAIIVDADADLDAAVQGALLSAFGYAGQKCSAASRLLVHQAVYDRFVGRLASAADRLVVGDPADPATDLGPLIDDAAQRRLVDAINQASGVGALAYQYPSERVPKTGHFVGPAIATGIPPQHPIANQELFGPLVCVFRVTSMTDALALANDTEYALTGGIYSRSPAHIAQAVEAFDVGNLYINRPITGAFVGRQPFGGHRLSGLGTKAGGPDYLLQLLIPKTICENTARHGMPLE